MGHHAFDYSIWEKEESPKLEKRKHSQRHEMKLKKRRQHDEWGDWDDWDD